MSLFFFVLPTAFSAQDNWNESEFSAMNHNERYEFVHNYQFWKIKDINITSNLLADMLVIASTKQDKQTALAIKSYIYILTSHFNYKIPINLTQEELKQNIKEEGVKLNKQKQVETIIKNQLKLSEKMGTKKRFGNYRPLIAYRLFSMFYELEDTNLEDIRFGRIVKNMKDSLNGSKGNKQFLKRQRAIEGDIYAEDLHNIKTESDSKIRNVIIFIFLLSLFFIGSIYLYLNSKKKVKENELHIAKKKITSLSDKYKKASSQIENFESKKEVSLKEEKSKKIIEQLINSTIITKEDWIAFKKIFEKVYPNFITDKQKEYTKLTPAELRILVLEKLDLSISEIAKMQGVNKNTIYQTKNRLAKKNSVL